MGLAAGLTRAWRGKRPYQSYNLKYAWLVLVGFIPHFLAFGSRSNEIEFDQWAPVALVSSQLLLVGFTVLNIKKPPFWAVGLGLLPNFIVIIHNSGMMPIQPEVMQKLIPGPSSGLWFLDDRLIVPPG
jgi:hypothetical protein